MGKRQYPIVVIGAGAGGLVVAIGAAKSGKKVLLIEKGNYGGDCTNFGCIPSKSLIAAAHAAYAHSNGVQFGLEGGTPFEKTDGALEYARSIVKKVRSHEDPEALKKKGVDTLTGTAKFLSSHSLVVTTEDGKVLVEAKNIVIATGSSPLIPEIKGLEGTPFLTNESIFDCKHVPKTLCILGGGPIGCELACAFSRLGSEVSIVHRGQFLLKKEEPEAQQLIAELLKKQGIQLHLGKSPENILYENQKFLIDGHISAEALLVSVGRKANIDTLDLAAANVRFTDKGIDVDRYGRTNQSHIWAIGDVLGKAQFTHVAENQARAVLTSFVLPGPLKKKQDYKQPIPRATFTDPEIASVGMLEKEAVNAYSKASLAVITVPFSEVDRAITAGTTEGFVKIITKKMSGRILGCTIVGPRAGEMIVQISTAIKNKISLGKLGSVIYPYPTYGLAIRRASDIWLTQFLLPSIKNTFRSFSWKRFIPLMIILVLMGVVYATGLHKYFTFTNFQSTHATLKAFVAAHPVITPILYIFIYAVATSLSIPGGAILSLLGGFLFPMPLSTAYVVVGATVGASVIFLAARSAIGDFLAKKAGPFLKKMEKGFQKNAWSYLLFLRFVPLFPFWLVNIAPAVFGISFWTFLWTTFVGIIPGAYVYTQTGRGLGAILETGQEFSIESILNIHLRIALVVLGLFALIPIIIKKLNVKKKK